MTLQEIIKALQENKEQAKVLLEALQHTNKERDWLLRELDAIKTREYNKAHGAIWVHTKEENTND